MAKATLNQVLSELLSSNAIRAEDDDSHVLFYLTDESEDEDALTPRELHRLYAAYIKGRQVATP